MSFPADVSFCFVQIIQLINQIIYGNIYSDPGEGNAETLQQPQASQSLREGVLLLHRGGLASFRWVKYGRVFYVCYVKLQKLSVMRNYLWQLNISVTDRYVETLCFFRFRFDSTSAVRFDYWLQMSSSVLDIRNVRLICDKAVLVLWLGLGTEITW